MSRAEALIMVVDDDQDFNDAISALLRAHHFEVLSFSNGADALSALRTRADVRAIVLDVTMPIMNGASFRGEQLADPVLASIPLVLVTARSDWGPIATALQPAACLRKPIQADDLLSVLEQFR
jgi:CheY-like chemotaxis protein